jgi:hypothetical protein
VSGSSTPSHNHIHPLPSSACPHSCTSSSLSPISCGERNGTSPEPGCHDEAQSFSMAPQKGRKVMISGIEHLNKQRSQKKGEIRGHRLKLFEWCKRSRRKNADNQQDEDKRKRKVSDKSRPREPVLRHDRYHSFSSVRTRRASI